MANQQEQLIRQGTQLQQDLLNLQDGGLLTGAGRAFLRSAGGTTTVHGQDGNPVRVPVHALVQNVMAQDLQRQLGEVRNNLQQLQAGAYEPTINPLGKVGSAAATTLKPVSKAIGSYPRAVVAGLRLKTTEVLIGPSPTMDEFIPLNVMKAAKRVKRAQEATKFPSDPQFIRRFQSDVDSGSLFWKISLNDVRATNARERGEKPQLNEAEDQAVNYFADRLLRGQISPEELEASIVNITLERGKDQAAGIIAQSQANRIAKMHTEKAVQALNESNQLRYADGRLLMQVSPSNFIRSGLALKLSYLIQGVQSYLQPPETRIPGLQLAVVDPNTLMGQQLAVLRGFSIDSQTNTQDAEANDQINLVPFGAFEPQWRQPDGYRTLTDTPFGERVQRMLWLIPAKTRWIRNIQKHWPFKWDATWGPSSVQKIQKYALPLKPISRLAPTEGRPESGTIMLRSQFKTVDGTAIPITFRNPDKRLSFLGGTRVIIRAINELGAISNHLNAQSTTPDTLSPDAAMEIVASQSIRPRLVAAEAYDLAAQMLNDPYFSRPTASPTPVYNTNEQARPFEEAEPPQSMSEPSDSVTSNTEVAIDSERATNRPQTSIREADARLRDFINQFSNEQAPSWEDARKVIANLINTLSSADNLSLPQLEALYQKYRLALQKGNQETVRILASQDAGVITDIMNQLTTLMRTKGSNVAGFSNHEIASLRTQGKLPSQPPTPPAQ